MQNMRPYHAAVWNEPIIYEMGRKGTIGHIVPEVEDEVKKAVGDVRTRIPTNMRRKLPPNLPELSEYEVNTHYLHLSQQTMGFDVANSIGVGTCTMKYSPKVNEQLCRLPGIADIHPLQNEDTVQGILEVMYKTSQWLAEITGMNEVSLQPAGGSHGVFTNCCMMRTYHKLNGELEQRREVITPLLSHPCNGAAPAICGFKVITLEPDLETGCPDVEAVKASVSKRTAGMTLTDPFDTGIFDRNIAEYVKIVHEAGGLVILDQAGANSTIGIVRAGDMGADMCHLNIHKTFSSPHGSNGPGMGAIGVKEDIRKFLPVPVVEFDGSKYHLNYDRPHSIGKSRGFQGNIPVALRAYAWMMSLGAEGIRQVAEIAVLNNNYMIKKLSDVPGLSLPLATGHHRMGEARYSWEQLRKDTGIGTEDLSRAINDYGIVNYFPAHHPEIVKEPMTPEPTESVSKADIDRFCEVIRHLSDEAYANPVGIKTAPHNCAISDVDMGPTMDIKKVALTWKAFLRKRRENAN